MLCMNRYPKDYIEQCRSGMEAQLTAYKALIVAAKGKPAFDSAVGSFEPLFFNNLVLVLDGFFVHRSRTLEGKDGNPLNEVRLISSSLLLNQGVMCSDKTIKYNPAKSVLKIQIGDPIQLTESDFTGLFAAFFAEIDARFL